MCLSSALIHFPEVKFGFAYGSGAIKQSGYDYTLPASQLPMIDFIFVVESTVDWHRSNKVMNPDHYTSILPFSPKSIAYIQDKMGANVWFNTAVEVPINLQSDKNSKQKKDKKLAVTSSTRLIKYGVISLENFNHDLSSWNTLYIAGRLHKPVQTLTPLSNTLQDLMQQNYDYALFTALTLLPSTFTEVDLYMKIASLSYTGDPRMGIGENPHKIANLVTSALPLYRQLYSSSIAKLLQIDVEKESNGATNTSAPYLLTSTTYHHINDHTSNAVASFTLNRNAPAYRSMVKELPASLMRHIRQQSGYSPHAVGKEAVQKALTQLVRRGAGMQTLKGVITIGIVKSMWYAAQKIMKRLS